MKFILTIGCILFALRLCGNIDSLQRALEGASGENEIRILMKLSEYYEQYDLDSALWYAIQAVEKAQVFGDHWLIGESHNGRGIIYDYLGEYDLALADYFRALAIYKDLGDERSQTGTLANIGLIYSLQSKNDSAIASYHRALEKAKAIGERSYEAYVEHNLGSVRQKKGHYRLALEHYLRSLEIKEALGDKDGMQYSLYNIGLIYYNLKLPRKALSQYFRILAAESTEAGSMSQSDLFHNIGMVYHNLLDMPDSAMFYYQKALTTRKSLGYKEGIAGTKGNLANLHQSLGNLDTALALRKEALSLDREIGDMAHMATSLSSLASIHLLKGQPSLAIQYINQAEALADSFHLRANLKSIYHTKVDVLRALGRDDEALAYYDKYTVISNSMLNDRISEQVLELETQYEAAEKDRAILEQQILLDARALSIERKNRWIAISAGGLFSLGIILLLLYWNSRNKQRLHRQQVATLQREQELQRLKAMMAGEERERSRIAKNLHDGVSGMLSAIKLYFTSLGRDDPALETAEPYTKARNLIDDTAKEVRAIAHNLMPDLLVRDGLAKALHQFCQHIQSSGMLQVDFQAINMDERLPQSLELTLYRIIQELLNNIMKHAQATEVVVQISRQGNRVECTVEDNGKGFSVNTGAEGAGLETIRNRLNYLDGELDIDSHEGQGTSVHIVVTLDTVQRINQ